MVVSRKTTKKRIKEHSHKHNRRRRIKHNRRETKNLTNIKESQKRREYTEQIRWGKYITNSKMVDLKKNISITLKLNGTLSELFR